MNRWFSRISKDDRSLYRAQHVPSWKDLAIENYGKSALDNDDQLRLIEQYHRKPMRNRWFAPKRFRLIPGSRWERCHRLQYRFGISNSSEFSTNLRPVLLELSSKKNNCGGQLHCRGLAHAQQHGNERPMNHLVIEEMRTTLLTISISAEL